MSDLIKCKTLAPVMHNGTIYSVGADIELTLQQYESLLSIKTVTPADANPPEKSEISNGGDKLQPTQFAGSTPPNSQAAPADANQTSVTDKGNAGAGSNPPAPDSPEIAEYANKTNADQLAYLDTLNDADFKIQVEKLLPVSKSKAKACIERRLKIITEGVE